MRRLLPPDASRSDIVVAIGGPIIGIIVLAVGLASSDFGTAIFGAVALMCGLAFAIPFVRSGRARDDDEGPR
jgi:uncharacterized membrane protein